MQRREFLKTSATLAIAAELGTGKALAFVPAHNWEKYDFGSGPPVFGVAGFASEVAGTQNQRRD